MPSQRESKIEDFAFDYLQTYYTTQQHVKGILICKAEKTKHGAEADGLFAFKSSDSTPFVAAISFRDAPQLARILVTYKKKGLSRWRYVTAVALFAATFLISKPLGFLPYTLGLSFITALAGLMLHSVLEKKHLKRRIEQVVDTLKKLPANEQWLGISISSLCFRNNSLANHLLQLCQRRGIGLITVGKRSKVVLMQEPATTTCRRGDFLSHYSSEQSIRKALQDDSMLRVA
ncbi:MAG: hypothetical protein LPK14_08970 [Hymenobacteraceae bacterium]|nr:hypothetical protein [Hymenobacteraceae bacterium]